MKALITLALVASALTLSSCACKDGKCPFGMKKKPAACATCCAATPAPTKAAKH